MRRESLALDTAFDLCRNRRRRALLTLLADRDRQVTVQDLAKDLAVRERDGPITEVPGEIVTEIHTMLYHVHLPKLSAAKVVDYDHERGHVALTSRGTELEATLRAIGELEPPT
ncbi:hypothetical protein ACFO5R_17820 [Halosolutus amylolyticus]|uniref:DUF7344 domain-containing protein n=1 Tax=Halosolutus amylolyticus TaxID=2932267 RepID=A0ABD5PTN0_9EURY|nr:hypothetical protein [Halosolutus amylolyticus]